MSGHFLSLLLLLACAKFTTSTLQYYITPSLNIPCLKHPCTTISQISTNSQGYFNNDVTVYFSFLPGNHTLDRELSMGQLDSFSMTKAAKFNETVFVQCTSLSARFIITQTRLVSIKGLHFTGCGSNRVTQVETFIAEDTIFQGVQGGGTAIILLQVGSARIIKDMFVFNSGKNSESPIEHEIVSKLEILHHHYQENTSLSAGGAIFAAFSNILIDTATFTENTAQLGGALFAHDSSLQVIGSTFTYNSAIDGGAIIIISSSIYIRNSTHSGNWAIDFGGVVLSENSIITFNSSRFINNIAYVSAVMQVNNSFVSATGSTFSENMAEYTGGVIYADNSTFSASGCMFLNNSAAHFSGVMETLVSSITLINCYLTANNAGGDSATIWCRDGSVNMIDIKFSNNTAGSYYGGVIFSSNCSIYVANSTFENNQGSLHVYHSKITFTGITNFKNCIESTHKIYSDVIAAHQEGGAITSFKSTIHFIGVTSFSNNQAKNGGAILATDSTLVMHSETNVTNNLATNRNGGALHLRQSTLEIKGNCLISNNHAMGQGGGIHAHSSQVTVHKPAVLQFVNNSAQYGGAMSLEVNSKLYLLKSNYMNELFIFKDNHASYGGAIYVADETNPDACSSNFDCFFQTLNGIIHRISSNNPSIIFDNNSAITQGSNLFGGLLDRCVQSPYAEIFELHNGLTYLRNISNITTDSVSSLPVSVCFCTNEGQPNCSYQPPSIKVRKGHTFTISLFAVDQVGHSVEANIISSLMSSHGGLGEGQHFQPVGTNCTNLKYNVFSPQDAENIIFFADGPCGDSQPSTRYLEIQFLNCSCSIGLKPSNMRPTACECICDKHMSPYVANCTGQLLILRENNTAWISYINDTDPPGYIIHRYCPLDYCRPSNKNISINLNLPNGADAQCAYNRTGVLCGACQKHLSLSLGSSRCLPCHSYWPVTFIVIFIASIVAGILLVSTLLILNMTVAVGLINSFVFYANIVGVSGMAFFPSSEPSFPTVFVAWLNLDIGIDVCFFDGLDAYTKTWLQLAFPVYIISLVVAIILVSEYSPRFAGLIGRKDPVATLATLILLSYTKLLSIALSALSYVCLHYPDGSTELVWLSDGNVEYLQGKHTVLVIVAAFIVVIGLSYTILLFLWQWLVYAPKGKVFAWTRNTKLNIFIATYHAPYNSKHRYWTGLLLFARVVLYITSSLTICSGPQTSLVATNILVGCLFLLKVISRIQVYKKLLIDVVETTLYFNIVVVTAVGLYNFQAVTQQTTVTYISTITTLLLLVAVIVYHFVLLIDKDTISQVWQKNQGQPPEQPTKSEITHSVIELPEPCNHPQETGTFELATIQETDSIQIITPPYQQ